MQKTRNESGETKREERLNSVRASKKGIPNNNSNSPKTKVLEQDVEMGENGAIDITTVADKDGTVIKDTVSKIKMKTISKQKRIHDTQDVSYKDTPNVVDELMKDGKSDMDSIVNNIKNSDILKVVSDSSNAIKERIDQIKKRKAAKEKEQEIEDKEEVELPEDTPKPDVEQYIQSVLALPKDENGVKLSSKMKPYLTKIAARATNGLTEEDITQAMDVLEREPIDYKGIAMRCPEEVTQCPHQECPFKKIGKIPTQEQCPIELAYIDSIIQRYMMDLAYDEDEMLSLAEMNLIVSLADVDVTDLRLRGFITQLGYLMEEVTVDPRSGKDILNKRINPIIDMMKTNDKRKTTVLRQLLATPEMKERLKVKRKSAKNGVLKDVTLKEKKVENLIEKVKNHNKYKLKGEMS